MWKETELIPLPCISCRGSEDSVNSSEQHILKERKVKAQRHEGTLGADRPDVQLPRPELFTVSGSRLLFPKLVFI